MAIRISKVTRELNVGSATLVEHLHKKGFSDVKDDLNQKISNEQYNLLIAEFSQDKSLREEANLLLQERQTKQRSGNEENSEQQEDKKEANTATTDVQQVFVPIDEPVIQIKTVGKISLDNLGPKKAPKEEIKRETQSVDQLSEPSVVEPKKPKQKLEPAISRQEKDKPEKDKSELSVVASKSEAVTEPVAAKPKEEPILKPAKPEIKNKDKKSDVLKEQEKEKVVTEKTGIKAKEEADSESESKRQKPVHNKQKVDLKSHLNTKPARLEAEVKPAASTIAASTIAASTIAASTIEPETEPETEQDSVYKIDTTNRGLKIKTVGKIDLSAINQSTRPKKKSKEEKKKEREVKDQQRLEQRKQFKESIIKEISKTLKPAIETAGEKKKKTRVRIGTEKIDISKTEGRNFSASHDTAPKHIDRNTRTTPSSPAGSRNARASRVGKSDKPIVTNDAVNRQIRNTFSKFSKGKNRSSKYRKDKRDAAFSRHSEMAEVELAESRVLKLTEFVTANELATMMNVPITQVIATCMSVGIMISINQRLDAETINIVADEYGFTTDYVSSEVAQAISETVDNDEDLEPRAPIVTVMGHVDHGKTSLLDYIRKSNVIAGEAGGITQHMGAYNVKLDDGRRITFLDTPGHEAFTAMRARGAQVTDIAIIIVAADDNVMPQTKEAIAHATAANVPIVFAINKVDKTSADPEKIKQELAQMNFLVEDWGGKYQSQDISAKKGSGVKELMEKVLLEAEMLDLKANPNRNATGTIIESSLDKGRGYIATVLVSNGTLKVGDIVLSETFLGKVKAMFNERNQRLKSAKPSEPVLILGLNGAPQAGVTFNVVETEREAREITGKREQLQREQGIRTKTALTLDELGRRIALGDFHELNLIVKADVDGSVEALSDSLIKLSTEKVQVNVIHKAVGAISESDVSLASASNAIIIGFDVRPSVGAKKVAEQQEVDIRLYSIIYDAIDEVKAAMEGLLAPQVKEEITATIEVLEVFHITKVGMVAGGRVREGKAKRNERARVIRDGIVIHTGNIQALKRYKEDVKEVSVGMECGINLVSYNDLKVGDMIETFIETEVKQTL